MCVCVCVCVCDYYVLKMNLGNMIYIYHMKYQKAMQSMWYQAV